MHHVVIQLTPRHDRGDDDTLIKNFVQVADFARNADHCVNACIVYIQRVVKKGSGCQETVQFVQIRCENTA